jgi:hypothetical protein
MLMNEQGLFEWLHKEYQMAVNSEVSIDSSINEAVPPGFPSEYAKKLPDEKANYGRKQVNKKVYQLACILYSNASEDERKEHLKIIHTTAKLRNGIPPNGFISYQGWEKIYVWLLNHIANGQNLNGTEDL